MNTNLVPDNIEKVKRSQFVTFLDTTPSATTPTWNLLGIGITEYGIAYNPQVEQEKWIIEDNARNIHESNQKQSTVSQSIYKNDPCFEFAYAGLDQLNYKTHILDIDRYNGSGSSFPAKMSDGILTITNYMGENATIEYDLYYDGDSVEGTVSFDSSGVPTFTPNTSL
jgi:hypothetical protein